MSDLKRPSEPKPGQAAESGTKQPLPGWVKGLLALSFILMLVGGGLTAWGWVAGNDGNAAGAVADIQHATEEGGDAVPAGLDGLGITSLDATTGNGDGSAGADGGLNDDVGSGQADTLDLSQLDSWSPTIFRLGFSFFIGFAIAWAAKKFLKLLLLIVGVLAIALFGLQYVGLIDVDWSAMEGWYDRITPWLREQTTGFGQFVTGYLPSTASAAAGLAVGLKKG